MSAHRVPITRQAFIRFTSVVRDFVHSEVAGRATLLFTLLVVFLLAINGLNVLNSYVGRDFMTAIAERDRGGFALQGLLYVGVFALSTVVAVVHRFNEERLGLLWREWLTRRLVATYLDGGTYYRLDSASSLTNPDQRIADDVRAFTTTTLSFLLLALNGLLTIIAFSGVMIQISPLLFGITVGYAALGSVLTILLGRPLVWLNYSQLDKEAQFRSDLIHIRENSESVALLNREPRFAARLSRQLGELVENLKGIIAANRNLSFFTTYYNYLIQIIPVLVVAPLYLSGKVEFGVITQSAMAFSYLVGAFSLIVTQFQSISTFAAVVARLDSLQDAFDKAREPRSSGIEFAVDEGRVAWEGLTLRAFGDERLLVKELQVSVPAGTRLLIIASDAAARVALLRATAGIWEAGSGRIVRPPQGQLLCLPERPYVPPGTLRELIIRVGQEGQLADDEILAVLAALGVEGIAARAGGLDGELDWDDELSLRDQQLLVYARLLLARPRFALLDKPSTTLGPDRVTHILGLLSERRITYLTLGTVRDPVDAYDAILELAEDGTWRRQAVSERGR